MNNLSKFESVTLIAKECGSFALKSASLLMGPMFLSVKYEDLATMEQTTLILGRMSCKRPPRNMSSFPGCSAFPNYFTDA